MNAPLVDNDLASIRQELNELRAEIVSLRKNGHGSHNGLDVLAEPALTDRRGMLKKVAGLAVGVAAVGLLKPSAAKAFQKDAPASTGSPLLLGFTNSANEFDTTTIQNPAFNLFPTLFVADNYGSNKFIAPADTDIALVGDTNNTGVSSAGNLIGVYGQAVAGNGAFATGVFGSGTHIGVSGVGSGNGCGVDGINDGVSTSAFGVRGSAGTGLGGFFSGARGAIGTGIGSGAVADPNVTIPNGGGAGDLYRGSSNGTLWYNAGGTKPYRRVADSTTAGALTAFPASSRFVSYNHLIGGATATYQIGGVTVTGNTVPATARAIIARIADANPTGSGVLLVGATNPPNSGVIAIVTGAPLNTFFFSALDATGKLYVKNSSASGSVDVIIDIQGYYE